ncbi:MAG TPA: ABC-F family ATP-binding cassette domain-containing protein [Polyangia bacterium]|jgi:ATP-binding cassette subfamily F protein uup
MSILLSAQGLHAAYGVRPLFEGVSFTVEEGDRIGLIGPNGAGKSTLLRILVATAAGDATEAGLVSRRRGLRVGLLEQVPVFPAGATVESVVAGGAGQGQGDHDDWERAQSVEQVMRELALAGPGSGPGVGAATPVASLSGGWKKRLALARELARRPDLLLLDEPTNHLDVESIEWLERLLAQSRFATITVTHDRYFLQRVATRIFELDRRNPGGLLAVAGDYAAYVRVKAESMHAQERREVVLRNTLRRETEWLRRGAAARTTKQQARIARAGELADEVAELGVRNTTRTAVIDFQTSERRTRRLIEARGVGKSYDGRSIFAGIDVSIGPGTRLALLGPNGCGKSTLLRVLLGGEPASAGTVFRADGLQVAYFAQERDALDPALSVADTVCPDGDYVSFRGARVHVRGYLERFLFTADQADMAVGKLSGGEQSRLLLARLMLRDAQVLVLDEPTNDLDLATLSVLEETLTEFDGAVLLVSHDRHFVDEVATLILAFDQRPSRSSDVVPFAGLAQWEAWRAESAAAVAAAAAPASGSPRAPATPDTSRPAGRRRLGYIEQREYDAIEATISAAEAALQEAVAESEQPENASNAERLVALLAVVSERRAEVDRLYARWAELEAKLAGD